MDNSAPDSLPRSETAVTYDSPYPLYAMSFSSSTHRIAVGSFLEDYNNRIDILSFDSDSMSLKPLPSLSFEHPYPPTKLMFSPPSLRRSGGGDLLSVMPGVVVKLLVSPGESVDEGQALLILEAMKMQNEIAAPQASLVQAVHVREGQAVASGARLVTLASASIDGQE